MLTPLIVFSEICSWHFLKQLLLFPSVSVDQSWIWSLVAQRKLFFYLECRWGLACKSVRQIRGWKLQTEADFSQKMFHGHLGSSLWLLMFQATKSIFFLSLFLSISHFLSSSLSFSLSHTHTHIHILIPHKKYTFYCTSIVSWRYRYVWSARWKLSPFDLNGKNKWHIHSPTTSLSMFPNILPG